MYVKTKKSILFKYVQFIVCQLYLSKAGKKILPIGNGHVICLLNVVRLVKVVSCVVFTS